MSPVVHLWIAVLVLAAATILEWTVLRMRYRNELARQHTRHLQHQQTTSRQAEQSKQQVGQLQQDLAAARLQVKRLTVRDATPLQSRTQAKEALERMLDGASPSPRRGPPDGFADTLPSQLPPDMLFR